MVMSGVLAACGGGGTGPTPMPTPSNVTTTLPTTNFSSLQSNEARFVDVQVNVTGLLAATAEWTFAANDLDVYVTSTGCNGVSAEDLNQGRVCALLGRADSVTAKPERLSMDVRPGSLRVWVASFGPGVESGTLSITVSGRP
jgi:hypothetical protein